MATIINSDSLTYGAEMLLKFYMFSTIAASSLVLILSTFIYIQNRHLPDSHFISPGE